MLDPEKKCLKEPEEIYKVFKGAGIELNQPLVASCGAGKFIIHVLLHGGNAYKQLIKYMYRDLFHL